MRYWGAFVLFFGLFTLTAAAQEKATVSFGDKAVLPAYGSVTGTWFFADTDAEQARQSQALLLGHDRAGIAQRPEWRFVADLAAGEGIALRLPAPGAGRLRCRVRSVSPADAKFELTIAEPSDDPNETKDAITVTEAAEDVELGIRHADGPVLFRLVSNDTRRVVVTLDRFERGKDDGSAEAVSLDPARRPQPSMKCDSPDGFEALTDEERAKIFVSAGETVECFPDLTEPLQNELVEWDWRLQDGIGTPNEPRTYLQAVEKRLPQLSAFWNDFIETAEGSDEIPDERLDRFARRLEELTASFEEIRASADSPEKEGRAETLWRSLHALRREIALAHPLFPASPILFAKHVPSAMSHQLTQVYGYCARPGGGLFILEEPGKSNRTRRLETGLPAGNYMHPSVSYDGKTILFAFCEVPKSPALWRDPEAMERYYQIYSIAADGSGLKRLTSGRFDHFAPTFLPDGTILCCSTRRGGFHRCGSGPCYVYTITKMNADGSEIRPISYHETQEWNPTVAADGRIVYTRWDYVDRDAVFYQNLWSMRSDGTDVRIYYGNNTFSPCGIWESKAVPGSSKIMAVGGPHHGMSAGSVILVDHSLGVDGLEPITRLTPEVLYPEAETPLPQIAQLPTVMDFDSEPIGYWNANRPDRPAERLEASEENARWPVHCFKSPWPLSEKYFLASYSYDKLLGEAGPNIPNQFGLYWCDAFGNRELLYRDPNIASVWAEPLTERPVPPSYVSTLPAEEPSPDGEPKPGRFFVQNVYESWPWKIPADKKIRSLRVVQVLPKTTPNANTPTVGAANASPGKQVLGTVEVADDGSAYFEVPSKTPFLLQALDERGRMVEGMRSLLYAQPGETQSCTGCHENRLAASPPAAASTASRQEIPSPLVPGPDGSRPLSYPILVQPVLDAKCVSCHNDEKAEGNVNLSGAPDGRYTKSYNALIRFVNFTAWGAPNGNHEPMTTPLSLGTPASALVKLLDDGHADCVLSDDDWERLCTWIDGANALFYGTFNPNGQTVQQTGGRIDGPDLE